MAKTSQSHVARTASHSSRSGVAGSHNHQIPPQRHKQGQLWEGSGKRFNVDLAARSHEPFVEMEAHQRRSVWHRPGVPGAPEAGPFPEKSMPIGEAERCAAGPAAVQRLRWDRGSAGLEADLLPEA